MHGPGSAVGYKRWHRCLDGSSLNTDNLPSPQGHSRWKCDYNAGISGWSVSVWARGPTVWIQDWLQPKALLHRSKVGIGHTGELQVLSHTQLGFFRMRDCPGDGGVLGIGTAWINRHQEEKTTTGRTFDNV